jgi:hypothetical protein
MFDQLTNIGMTGVVGGMSGVVGTVVLSQLTDTGRNIFSGWLTEEIDAATVRGSDAFAPGDTVRFSRPGVTGVYRGVEEDRITVEVDDGLKFLPLGAYDAPFTVVERGDR